MRCWIHTHPRFSAFMSTTDILQLHHNACLGIVLSPRGKGVKALVVALTDFGFHIVEALIKRADMLKEHIYQYPGAIYYQIPFEVVADACTVLTYAAERKSPVSCKTSSTVTMQIPSGHN